MNFTEFNQVLNIVAIENDVRYMIEIFDNNELSIDYKKINMRQGILPAELMYKHICVAVNKYGHNYELLEMMPIIDEYLDYICE